MRWEYESSSSSSSSFSGAMRCMLAVRASTYSTGGKVWLCDDAPWVSSKFAATDVVHCAANFSFSNLWSNVMNCVRTIEIGMSRTPYLLLSLVQHPSPTPTPATHNAIRVIVVLIALLTYKFTRLVISNRYIDCKHHGPSS